MESIKRQVEQLADQVKQLDGSVDEAVRNETLVAIRDVMYAIETPADTFQRIRFLNLQISVIRIGIDLKIFKLLAEASPNLKHPDPLSLRHLTEATGANSVLLGRLLRYLASMGIIKETERDHFAATNVTTTLASPGNQAAVCHCFDILGPVFQELPKFLAEQKHQSVANNTKTAFQDAWKTELSFFGWLPQRAEAFANFNQYMASRRDASASWLSVYPIQQETEGWNPELPVFVDMGGGIGHQCAQLKAEYPQLPGCVVLQELSHCINDALPTPGIENMVHDIFRPQPIRGAKFYHLRTVLHMFSDDKCREILQNIVQAMGKDSLILIEEMVLPDTHVHWQAAQLDLTMMVVLAATERTETQWRELLDSVGLAVVKTYVVTPWVHESVMVVALKQGLTHQVQIKEVQS